MSLQEYSVESPSSNFISLIRSKFCISTPPSNNIFTGINLSEVCINLSLLFLYLKIILRIWYKTLVSFCIPQFYRDFFMKFLPDFYRQISMKLTGRVLSTSFRIPYSSFGRHEIEEI